VEEEVEEMEEEEEEEEEGPIGVLVVEWKEEEGFKCGPE
jgi:hypothetical protein